MPGEMMPKWSAPILHPGIHGEDLGPGQEAAHAEFPVLLFLNWVSYSRTPLAW